MIIHTILLMKHQILNNICVWNHSHHMMRPHIINDYDENASVALIFEPFEEDEEEDHSISDSNNNANNPKTQ